MVLSIQFGCLKTHSGSAPTSGCKTAFKKRQASMTRPGCISQTGFENENEDLYFSFYWPPDLCLGAEGRQKQQWGAGTAYSGLGNELVMLTGHQMDLTSPKTSFCIFMCHILLGQRAKLLQLHHYSALSHPLLLAIRALFGDTSKVPVHPGWISTCQFCTTGAGNRVSTWLRCTKTLQW